MQKAAKTSRFLIDFSSEREFADSGIVVSHSKLLKDAVVGHLAHAANSTQIFNGLFQSLIRLAEHSFSLRDVKTLQEISRILVNLPFAKAAQIGRYYQAIATSRIGEADEAISLLEAVADNAPLLYRARAIQTLGSIYHRHGHHDEALRLFHETSRVVSPENWRAPFTTLLAHLELTCIKSEMGDHRGALADYEKLSPLVQIVSRENPLYFYFYHNELAVEFAELGRLAEAEAVCAIALASPFAHAYPEWSETRDEIAEKRTSATPSVVAVSRAPEPAALRRAEPGRNSKRVARLALSYPASSKDFFQRSVFSVPAITTIALNAVSILDRVLSCIRPRAPPVFS
jgi:tetratricopeptide (TPR) repeat protein